MPSTRWYLAIAAIAFASGRSLLAQPVATDAAASAAVVITPYPARTVDAKVLAYSLVDVANGYSVPIWKPGDPVTATSTPAARAEDASLGDRALGSAVSASVGMSPLLIGTSFDGIPSTGQLPPGVAGDVGIKHYVQMVRSAVAVYSKTGVRLAGPLPFHALWGAVRGPCFSPMASDPIVRYDAEPDRWILTASVNPPGDGPHQCVAVSRTGDPVTGGWFLYAFPMDNVLPNAPAFGVWGYPDIPWSGFGAYYLGSRRTGTDAGADAWAFERGKLAKGAPAQMVHFALAGPALTPVPSDFDPRFDPPLYQQPLTSTNLFVRVVDGERFGGTDRLEMYAFDPYWTRPEWSSFKAVASVALPPFDSVVCTAADGSGACVPQPGTPVRLDTRSALTTLRVPFRYLSRDFDRMLVSHTVKGDSGAAAVRWYELLTNTSSKWVINQMGTIAADGAHAWMSSPVMDASGDIAVAYYAASATLFPSIRVAARGAVDRLATLPLASTLTAGGGAQTYAPAPRWGPTVLHVDPTTGCTFWYTGAYYAASSEAGWRTRIGSFTVPACNGTIGSFAVTNMPAATIAKYAAGIARPPLVGDFDGDGKSDIAFIEPYTFKTLPVALSNGDGTFRFTNEYVGDFIALADQKPVTLLVGDFNGDKRSDIALVGGWNWTTVPVALSLGDGKFSNVRAPLPAFAKWATAAIPVVGDFNKDGKSDIALVSASGTIPVAFANGDGSFTVTNQSSGGFATYMAAGGVPLVGDFNGDGRSDIALVGPSGTIPVLYSKGDGTFTFAAAAARYFPGLLAGAKVFTGSFDRTGRDDILLIGAPGQAGVIVAFPQADGSFYASSQTPGGNFLTNAAISRPLVGDFSGDGQTDIALVGQAGLGGVPVAVSLGNGFFAVGNVPLPDFAAFAAVGYAVAGDFNGDRRTDIAVIGKSGWTSVPIAFSVQ